ncbi:MAG: ATP phosphoribosyltransferase regulatory subunit [Rickettsiales bacterium]|nr:ATP phosphoribosyltransferase regulatory subunit [Rickettsiales bacterium]
MKNKTLLPSGCYDLLPPYARQESTISQTLLSVYESFGYEQVSPPLLEYSENLLAGRGAALSSQIFRVMDPGAHKVMGIRADITLQIARIADGRLSHAPRPLRLCYNGLILRMQGEQLKGDRQLRQAGIELIGPNTSEADAEVILVAANALKKVGIKQLSIDLNLPGIVSSLLAAEKLESDVLQKLLEAIAHKDISTIRTINFMYRESLIGLLQSAGPAKQALEAIQRLDLPESARKQCHNLIDVIHLIEQMGEKEWNLTIDVTESRGLDYHSGISFSIFVPGAACEVGRGGRYKVDDTDATGFTLYVETLRSLLPEPTANKRVFIKEGIGAGVADKLRAEGYVVIFALSEYGREDDEAKRLQCDYVFENEKVRAVK